MDNKKLIHDTVVATLAACNERPKPADDCYKTTEARLWAYPTLKANLEEYEADIRDLKREHITEKSKDITCWGGAGSRLSPEEKQQARIIAVQVKLERDKAEIAKIDRALDRLEASEGGLAGVFISQVYFKRCPLEDVALIEGCSLSTIQRRRTRLVRQLALILYGAEALI